ncbi:hypothetical protein [Myxococcus stipitatus]|uniref:hypothetical protein n=1 Tax=Myxococcus stipitatus TaxID=83455 RepID=UPI0030D2F3AE
MDLDTWVRKLVEDASCREKRFTQLNALYALGVSAALARSGEAPENPRQSLDEMCLGR